MTKVFRYIIVLCVAQLIASCTTDTNDLEPLLSVEYSSMPIAFSTEENVSTRGTQTTTSDLTSFAVNARYYTIGSSYGRDFFDGQVITKNTTWTYSPVKYWPTAGTMDFYAYSPTLEQQNGTFESLNMVHNEAYVWLMHYSVATPVITSITELSGSTIPQATFDKAVDAQRQQDLLLASNVNNLCSEERGINSKVCLSFKHALAGLTLQLAAGATLPTGATHVILSIAPMCAGGTIAMDAQGSIAWTTDESEATYYQAYAIDTSAGGSPVLQAPSATDDVTFFLPPQRLKNFTITARFYRKESNQTYTHIATRSSSHHTIDLTCGTTRRLSITIN